jgi:hypothetical protein
MPIKTKISIQGTETGRFSSGVAMHIELQSNHAYKEMIRDLAEEARIAAGCGHPDDAEERRAEVKEMKQSLFALIDCFVPPKKRG